MTDPVGIQQIADRLGVQPNTVYAWRKRGLFPAPDWQVGNGPAWDWHRIDEWARATYRKAYTGPATSGR